MEAPCKKSAKGVKLTPSSSSSSFCFITNLPTPIVMEILCRLPLKTLTASKSVCKLWLHLIRDPHFFELHQARAPTEVCFQLCRDEDTIKLHMCNFRFLDNFEVLDDFKLNTLFELPKFSVRHNNDINYHAVKGSFHFANSCNGLLCYYGGTSNRFVVAWNPCTSEFITLPALKKHNATSNCCGYGLGFSRKTSKYKLLRVVRQEGTGSSAEVIVAEICTLEKGCSWKTVGPCPSNVWDAFRESSYKDPLHAIFLQGALHWLSDTNGNGSGITILTFDFEDEQFGRVPLPASFDKSKHNNSSFCRVGELKGCLFITDFTNEGMNVWLMKEYGVQDSWTRIYCLRLTIKNKFLKHNRCLPITCMENGEILMTCSELPSTIVFFYNPDSEHFRFIGYGPFFVRVIAYRPSLVPLKDSMLGYKVHVKSRCALKHREMSTTPSWWIPLTNGESLDTAVEEEREGNVSVTSEFSAPESSTAMSAHQQGTEALTTGIGGESHGHIGGEGLIQISTHVVVSAQETLAAELACQQGSMIPLITDEVCVSAMMEEVKTMKKEVLELKNEYAKQLLKEQIGREFEERLQDEQAKVKQLEEKIQQSEQFKHESKEDK